MYFGEVRVFGCCYLKTATDDDNPVFTRRWKVVPLCGSGLTFLRALRASDSVASNRWHWTRTAKAGRFAFPRSGNAAEWTPPFNIEGERNKTGKGEEGAGGGESTNKTDYAPWSSTSYISHAKALARRGPWCRVCRPLRIGSVSRPIGLARQRLRAPLCSFHFVIALRQSPAANTSAVGRSFLFFEK